MSDAVPLNELFKNEVVLDGALAKLKKLRPDAPEKSFNALYGDLVPPLVRALGCPDLLPRIEADPAARAEAVKILHHASSQEELEDEVRALEDFVRHLAIEAYL